MAGVERGQEARPAGRAINPDLLKLFPQQCLEECVRLDEVIDAQGQGAAENALVVKGTICPFVDKTAFRELKANMEQQ